MSELEQTLSEAATETRLFVESTVDLEADLLATLKRSRATEVATDTVRWRRSRGAYVGLATAAGLIALLIGALAVIDRGDGGLEPANTISPSPSTILRPAPTIIDSPIIPESTVAPPTSTNTTAAEVADATISNGWVAGLLYGDDGLDTDIYLAKVGTPAHRVAGSDTDNDDQRCPAISPDGSRLAFGQATGDRTNGYQNAAVIITDLDADGDPTATTTLAVDGLPRPPCPIWSPDGRMVAFGAGTLLETCPTGPPEVACFLAWPTQSEEVWIVDTDTGGIRKLTGLSVTDIDWAPASSELFIASDGVVVYSLARDETRTIDGTSGVLMLAVSPDGQTLAAQHGGAYALTIQYADGHIEGPCCSEIADLWVMDTDGSDQRTLVTDYQVDGPGPLWSPDGSRIVFQSVCVTPTFVDATGQVRTCKDESNAVVISLSDDDPLGPRGTQTVIPHPETTDNELTRQWNPTSVVWSPDGTTLLYSAWSDTRDQIGSVGTGSNADLAVPIDSTAPPVILHENDLSANPVGIESPDLQSLQSSPFNVFQSWGKSPD